MFIITTQTYQQMYDKQIETAEKNNEDLFHAQ